MTLRQRQLVVEGVFNQTAHDFYQPLPQTGERPVGNLCRQRQLLLQTPQVVNETRIL